VISLNRIGNTQTNFSQNIRFICLMNMATGRIKIGISNYPLLLKVLCQTIKNITLDPAALEGVNHNSDQRDLLITSSNKSYIMTKKRVCAVEISSAVNI
jgi:hypothetical protein